MNIRSFMGESFGELSQKKKTNDQISSQNSTQHFASKSPSVVSKETPGSITNNFAKMPVNAMNQTSKSSASATTSQQLDMSINSKTFTSEMPLVPVMQKTRNKAEAGTMFNPPFNPSATQTSFNPVNQSLLSST